MIEPVFENRVFDHLFHRLLQLPIRLISSDGVRRL
jgi:hypothetical protein